MNSLIQQLHSYIKSFLEGRLNGRDFEKAFADCYDFEDFDEGDKTDYLKKVRGILERFSDYETDLKEHSNYFINEEQVKLKIRELQ